jgi:tRNA pseudouridine55 synthase
VTLVAGNRPRSGLILLRKPEGITSFQALFPVKRALGTGKVGHAGTLDRFASGLLVLLAGPYSRLASYVAAGEKTYRGLIAFGSETDTLDPEGEVIATAPPPSLEALEAALGSFRGRILQRPPAYSAVHVQGKRAYQLAREGLDPEMKERQVEVFSLELLSYEGGEALVELRCSSGTYVRSLARDIAVACGSRSHLRALERLAIGPFSVEDAVSPEAFDPGADLRPFSPLYAAALGLRAIGLEEAGLASRFRNGGKIDASAFSVLDGGGGIIGCESAVYGPGPELLGIVRVEGESLKYRVVLPGSAA